MEYLFKKGSISVRKMRDSICDYVFLAEWLSTPELLDYYDEGNSSDLDKVLKKYTPRVKGEENISPCIIEYDGIAVGYIQYYEVDDDKRRLYEVSDKLSLREYKKPMAIDILIGKVDYWNKGIGTETVGAMLTYLFDEMMADIVVIDPQTNNDRAIRCYSRAGFKEIGVISSDDKDFEEQNVIKQDYNKEDNVVADAEEVNNLIYNEKLIMVATC